MTLRTNDAYLCCQFLTACGFNTFQILVKQEISKKAMQKFAFHIEDKEIRLEGWLTHWVICQMSNVFQWSGLGSVPTGFLKVFGVKINFGFWFCTWLTWFLGSCVLYQSIDYLSRVLNFNTRHLNKIYDSERDN